MFKPISGKIYESNPYYPRNLSVMKGKEVKDNDELQKNENTSYVLGKPLEDGLVYATMPSLLDHRAQTMPSKEAHVFLKLNDERVLQREAITFGHLSRKSLELANELIEIGLIPDDKIVLAGRNSPEWIYVEYAALRMKILVLKLPEELASGPKIVKTVADYNCRAVIVDPGEGNSLLKSIAKNLPGIDSISNLGSSKVRIVSLTKPAKKLPIRDISEMIETNKAGPETILKIQKGLSPDDDAIINTSSGTMGFPKFSVMSHFSYINNLYAADNIHLMDLMVRFFNDRPFSWICSFLYASVTYGITMIHMDPKFTADPDNAKDVFHVFQEEEVSVAIFMPAFLQEMAQAKEVLCPKHLRYVITGGDLVPVEISNFCSRHFEGTVVLYTSAETGIAAQKFIRAGDRLIHDGPSRFNIELEPLPFVELRLTNSENVVMHLNYTGELWVRSPYILKNYLEEEDKRDQVIIGGWVNTGDVAIMNDKRQVEILGKNMAIKKTGGGVVYPVVVEFFLHTFPKVSKAVVVSIAEDSSVDNICACIVFEKGYWVSPSGLRKFFNRNMIADEGSVHPTHFLIFDGFPLLGNGKVDRRKVTVMAIDKLDEGEGNEEIGN